MIITLTMIVFALLLVVSLIDFRTKHVPAFLTTSIIFLVAMVNMADIQFGLIHLAFGVLAFIFAYLLYEAEFIGGVADIKVMVIIGMMVTNIFSFFMFLGLVMLFGFLYKLVWRFILKKSEGSEVPYLLSLWAIYVILWMQEGLI